MTPKNLAWIAQLKFDFHVVDLLAKEPRLTVAQADSVVAARIRIGTITLGNH